MTNNGTQTTTEDSPVTAKAEQQKRQSTHTPQAGRVALNSGENPASVTHSKIYDDPPPLDERSPEGRRRIACINMGWSVPLIVGPDVNGKYHGYGKYGDVK